MRTNGKFSFFFSKLRSMIFEETKQELFFEQNMVKIYLVPELIVSY